MAENEGYLTCIAVAIDIKRSCKTDAPESPLVNNSS